MKRNWNGVKGILAALGLLVLIFDGNLALRGARAGMELCIKTVIPSLFPFFVLSMILTQSLSGQESRPVLFLARLLGIPKTAVSVVVPAFLGGYPVGAKCVSDLFVKNQIHQKEAERMLAFCSNAGPSFLFGMVSGFFPERKMVWLLWAIHISGAVLTAAVLPAKNIPVQRMPLEKQLEESFIILSAAKAMGLVCCWVILFRMILTFLDVWFFWMIPNWVQVLLTGMLELTNGCCALLMVTDVHLRFLLCSCMLSFGGICVLFQTASVTKGLSLKYYVCGKLIQTVFSFLLSYAVIAEHGLILLWTMPVLIIILRKIENRYSNPRPLPV